MREIDFMHDAISQEPPFALTAGLRGCEHQKLGSRISMLCGKDTEINPYEMMEFCRINIQNGMKLNFERKKNAHKDTHIVVSLKCKYASMDNFEDVILYIVCISIYINYCIYIYIFEICIYDLIIFCYNILYVGSVPSEHWDTGSQISD